MAKIRDTIDLSNEVWTELDSSLSASWNKEDGTIENQSIHPILIQSSDVQPDASYNSGLLMNPAGELGSVLEVPSQFLKSKLYVRSTSYEPQRIALRYSDLVQRYFTTLTAAGGMYYSLASPVTLSGDFEVEFDFLLTTENVNQHILSSDRTDSGNDRVTINSSNQLIIVGSNGAFVNVGNIFPFATSGAKNRIKIRVNSNKIYISINSNDFSPATFADTINIKRIGMSSYYLTPTFNGIISNVTIKQSGTLTNSWALDSDGTTSTELDTVGGNNATRVNMTAADTELFTKDGADWVGKELWVNPSLNGWLDNGGGEYELNGDGSFQSLQIATVTPNIAYRVTFNIAELSAPLKIQSTSVASSFSKLGHYSIDFIPDGTTLNFARVSGIVNATLRDISVKRLIEVA